MKTFLQKNFLLLAILILGLILRVYLLGDIPTGLHGDEASVGYNAYSLLKTGHDQNGVFLPLAIDQFGDFRPAGIHYIDILSVGVLGLNTLAVRLPAALFGAATIIVFYLFLQQLFGKKPLSLIGAFLLAVSPWHIDISRATSEGIIAAFFVILATVLLLHSFQKVKHKTTFLLLGFLFYFVSFLFYHAARVFVPLFLIVLLPVAYYHYKLSKKYILTALGLSTLLFLGLFFLLTVGKGSYRASSVSILNIPGGTQELKQSLDEEGNTQSTIITRLLHNKVYFYTRLFAVEYTQHFTLDFLFVNNGFPVRYRIPWTGNLYPIEAPFLLLAFAVLLVGACKEKKLLYLIPLVWLLLGPVPAGLTWEDIPNVERAVMQIFGLIMLSSFGIYEFTRLPWKKPIKISLSVIFICIFVQNFFYFVNNYYYHSRIDAPWFRSAAIPELLKQVDQLQSNYDKVVMTTQGNNNFIFYLYYTKFDPKKFQELGSPREKDNLHFGKLIYTYNGCPLSGDPTKEMASKDNYLYVNQILCTLPKNAEIVSVINNPDFTPAYKIVRLLPVTSSQQE